MNILHLKYAVEVARCGSINQAAEALYINQPNLSRAIKELENSLGITIFDRTAKGMFVTPEGEEFLGYAKKILSQIDEVESIYKAGVPIKQRFSISVPRASYISEAFAQFSKSLKSFFTRKPTPSGSLPIFSRPTIIWAFSATPLTMTSISRKCWRKRAWYGS